MRKLAFEKITSGVAVASLVVSALLVSAHAHAQTPPPAAPSQDVVITEDARRHFAAGVALLKDPKEPRYEEAYREFKAAYAASPSYKILGNLALCAMKIERDQEAIDAYEQYMKRAGPELTQDERDQIGRDLLTLKSGVVHVTVSSDPPGATITDVRVPITGGEVRNSYGEAKEPLALGIRRGHHIITARLAGYVDATWEFEASGQDLPPYVFHLQKPAKPTVAVTQSRPIPTAAYVTGGISIAMLLAGTVVGFKAVQDHSDFDRLNDGQHVAQAQSVHDSGQRLNIVSDVFYAGALIGAGVTAYFVLTRPTLERPATESATIVPKVTPTWGPHGAGASALWTF